MAPETKNSNSLRRSRRLVDKTSAEDSQAEEEPVEDKPASADEKDRDGAGAGTGTEAEGAAKDRIPKKLPKKAQVKSPSKQSKKMDYAKSTISPTNRTKKKEDSANSMMPVSKWPMEPMSDEFNASKSFPVDGTNRVTSDKAQGGGAFQDYSNRNPSYDRMTGSKPESEMFGSYPPQANAAQGKAPRKKKASKNQKGGTKASQVSMPMEHASGDQSKPMNETSMAQPDMFDRNVSQDQQNWMNLNQNSSKQPTNLSFQPTRYRQYSNSVRMGPSGYDPSSAHWNTSTADVYTTTGKGVPPPQLSNSVPIVRPMYQSSYQNTMMSPNDQQSVQNQQPGGYSPYNNLTYFPGQQGIYGGNQQLYNRPEYPADYSQPSYPVSGPHFDRDPQASAFNPSTSAHMPYNTSSYSTGLDTRGMSKEMPGRENSGKPMQGSIYPSTNMEVPPGGDFKGLESQIDEQNLTPAERRRRRKEMNQNRNMNKSSNKEAAGSKSRVDPEEDISLRKAIGITPDGLDILEPPRTSKRGRTPYLNAAICRDSEGRVKLQRQDFMNALKQSREARSKETTMSAPVSNSQVPDSKENLPTKSADNAVNNSKDTKDDKGAGDDKPTAVGTYSVVPIKNQAADDSAQDDTGDGEEDVDLEARKKVEELKKRLKTTR